MCDKEAEASGSKLCAFFSRLVEDRTRALVIPLVGVAAVLVICAMTAGERIFPAALTAIVTLTAAAGGHAAGSAKNH